MSGPDLCNVNSDQNHNHSTNHNASSNVIKNTATALLHTSCVMTFYPITCHPSACQHVDGPHLLPSLSISFICISNASKYTFHHVYLCHVVCGSIWNVFVVHHAVSAVVHVPQCVHVALHGFAVSVLCHVVSGGMFCNVSVHLSVVHHSIFPLNPLSAYLNAHCYLLCLQWYSGPAKHICLLLKNDGCMPPKWCLQCIHTWHFDLMMNHFLMLGVSLCLIQCWWPTQVLNDICNEVVLVFNSIMSWWWNHIQHPNLSSHHYLTVMSSHLSSGSSFSDVECEDGYFPGTPSLHCVWPLLGKVMGMGTHLGLWVWVQVGVGVGTGFGYPHPYPYPHGGYSGANSPF